MQGRIEGRKKEWEVQMKDKRNEGIKNGKDVKKGKLS